MSLKIVAAVPARLGSQRVKCKNLRMLAGKPLIAHVIETLKKCQSFSDIYINSDSDLFGKVAQRYDVKFYKRALELATSQSLIDDYIYDFSKKVPSDILAIVSPTSPFISAEELDKAVDYFVKSDFDTLLSCEKIQTHCFMKGQPINFSIKGKHPRSQDIEPVRALNFAITIWRTPKYLEHYEKNGYGVYTGKLGFWDIEGFSAIDVDYEEDFLQAEIAAKFIQESASLPKGAKAALYDSVLDEILAQNIRTEN